MFDNEARAKKALAKALADDVEKKKKQTKGTLAVLDTEPWDFFTTQMHRNKWKDKKITNATATVDDHNTAIPWRGTQCTAALSSQQQKPPPESPESQCPQRRGYPFIFQIACVAMPIEEYEKCLSDEIKYEGAKKLTFNEKLNPQLSDELWKIYETNDDYAEKLEAWKAFDLKRYPTFAAVADKLLAFLNKLPKPVIFVAHMGLTSDYLMLLYELSLVQRLRGLRNFYFVDSYNLIYYLEHQDYFTEEEPLVDDPLTIKTYPSDLADAVSYSPTTVKAANGKRKNATRQLALKAQGIALTTRAATTSGKEKKEKWAAFTFSHLGITQGDVHDALYDCELLCKVLLQYEKSRNGDKSLLELIQREKAIFPLETEKDVQDLEEVFNATPERNKFLLDYLKNPAVIEQKKNKRRERTNKPKTAAVNGTKKTYAEIAAPKSVETSKPVATQDSSSKKETEDQRTRNVILTNLPEFLDVSKLIETIKKTGMTNSILSAARMGRATDRARPLKIICASKTDAQALLNNFEKIAIEMSLKRARARPDYNDFEFKLFCQLCKEAHARNTAAKKKLWEVRDLSIVLIRPVSPNSNNKTSVHEPNRYRSSRGRSNHTDAATSGNCSPEWQRQQGRGRPPAPLFRQTQRDENQ